MPLTNKPNPVLELSFSFAIEIVEYCQELENLKKWVISNQLLKSGTSIGANVREAQNAESRQDFIHKFKIAAKEIEETLYWLEICNAIQNFPSSKLLIKNAEELKLIVSKIIITSKSNKSSN